MASGGLKQTGGGPADDKVDLPGAGGTYADSIFAGDSWAAQAFAPLELLDDSQMTSEHDRATLDFMLAQATAGLPTFHLNHGSPRGLSAALNNYAGLGGSGGMAPGGLPAPSTSSAAMLQHDTHAQLLQQARLQQMQQQLIVAQAAAATQAAAVAAATAAAAAAQVQARHAQAQAHAQAHAQAQAHAHAQNRAAAQAATDMQAASARTRQRVEGSSRGTGGAVDLTAVPVSLVSHGRDDEEDEDDDEEEGDWDETRGGARGAAAGPAAKAGPKRDPVKRRLQNRLAAQRARLRARQREQEVAQLAEQVTVMRLQLQSVEDQLHRAKEDAVSSRLEAEAAARAAAVEAAARVQMRHGEKGSRKVAIRAWKSHPPLFDSASEDDSGDETKVAGRVRGRGRRAAPPLVVPPPHAAAGVLQAGQVALAK